MMRYLLDVNALIALGIVRHEFHSRVIKWANSLKGATFLTCSITELGFVRIAARIPSYQFTVQQAKHLLLELKTRGTFRVEFVQDANESARLPAWVQSASQTTDGQLAGLAKAHNALLATLDRGIPDSFLIPADPRP
jgi:uncharacterized protein